MNMMDMMEERPKSRLCLKLGQRKLSFQQKPSTNSKTQEEPITRQDQPCNSASTKEEEVTSREIPPLSGLCNLGNTCYVNSLLQPLRFCPQFSQWIEELHQLSERVGIQQRQPNEPRAIKLTDRIHAQSVDDTSHVSLNVGVSEDEAMDCSEEEKPSVGLATHLYMVKVVSTYMHIIR